MCKVRPLGSLYYYRLLALLTFLLPFDIVLLFIPFDIVLFMIAVIYYSVVLLVFFLIRLFNFKRYEIDEEYIRKYDDTSIVFKLKRTDLLKVYVKRAPWYDYWFFLYDILSGGILTWTHGTRISFVFKKCEVLARSDKEKSLPTEMPLPSLKHKYDEKNLSEYVCSMTYAEAMRLCKILNIVPEILKNKKR